MSFLGDNRWLVIVLPGFIALFVASFISDFPEVRDTQLPIVYIALTALSVAVPFFVVHLYGKAKGVPYSIDSLIRSPLVVSSIFACSLVLGFLFGVAHATDYISRGLRSFFGKDLILTPSHSDVLHFLMKTSYSNKFMDGHPYIKTSANRYARIYSSDSRNVYEGVITSYFNSTETAQVYLSPACLLTTDAVTPINGPGAWMNMDKVSDIQFIDARCSVCAEQVALTSGRPKDWVCPFTTRVDYFPNRPASQLR